MKVRAAVAITMIGLVVHGLALWYMTNATRIDPVILVLFVILPIAIVSFGTLTGMSGARQETRLRRSVMQPFIIGSLVLVSAIGPAMATQTILASRWPEQLRSSIDVRADFVLLAARDNGPAAALTLLREQVRVEPDLILRGHHLAHEIGQISIEKADFDLALLRECKFDFASGCFHGMLERYFFARPEIDESWIPSFCEELTGDSTLSAESLECSHGLGHGLAVRSNHAILPAVRTCDLLDSKIERRECHDGVFMEVSARSLGEGHLGSAASGHGTAADHADAAISSNPTGSDDPSFPCNTVGDAYKESCWAYQYVSIRANSGNSWDRTVEGCRASGSPSLAEKCIFGVGKQLASENYFDWDEVFQMCRALPLEEGQACISGAVEHLVDFAWASDRAFEFCRVSPAPLAESCHFRLGTRLGFLFAAPEAMERCASNADRLESACRQGVNQSHDLRATGNS